MDFLDCIGFDMDKDRQRCLYDPTYYLHTPTKQKLQQMNPQLSVVRK